MNIVIATGEPRGAYHLHPLRKAAQQSSNTFIHLTPYPEPVQGEPWLNTSSDPYILKTADKVVVTGGGFTAWTSLVASAALSYNKTLIMTELAIGAKADNKPHPSPNYITALSPASAKILAEYHNFPLSKINITGTPLLDEILPPKPTNLSALLLSTVSRPTHDPDNLLLLAHNYLKANGYKVKVRPHPRENISDLTTVDIDHEPTLHKEASKASLILAYPGTPLPILAALNLPIIILTPNSHFKYALPEPYMDKFIYRLSRIEQLPDLLQKVKPLSTEQTLHITGPIGNSAERVIHFWDYLSFSAPHPKQ